MFASRVEWPLNPNRLSEQIEERRRRGLAILDLTESNPTRCGFLFDSQEILGALADPRSLIYEPDPRGLLLARLAVASYYAERGVKLDPDQIFLTTSTSEAYSYVFRLLANPGDNILVPRPSYPLFDFLARLDDLELVPYPLIYDHRWQMDLEALAARLGHSEGATGARGRTRAILVVHPNNPTGSFVRQDELEFLLSCCKKQSLPLIADEVFADYSFGPVEPSGESRGGSRTALTETRAGGRFTTHATVSETLTFTLSGLSKISALPQMKLAWVVVTGPADYVKTALARLEVIADTYLSVSAPVAHALPKLLEARHSLQPQILERIRSNLRWLDEQLSWASLLPRLQTEGGWYAVLKLPSICSDEDWAVKLLSQDGVLVHPGHFYDFPSDSHLVVSLLPKPDIFREGIRKILAGVNSATEHPEDTEFEKRG